MEFSTIRAERLSQACNGNSLTGKEYGVPFPTEKHVEYPVYLVPIEILSYNFGNGRIAAEKGSLEHRRGKKFSPNISFNVIYITCTRQFISEVCVMQYVLVV